MPFTKKQIEKRRNALATQEATERQKREMQEARDREERALRATLTITFPDIPIEDAVELWKIAVVLTNALVSQFERGEEKLEVSTDTWESLFIDTQYSFGYGGGPQATETPKDYLPALQRMGRLHNDVGQAFDLQRMHFHEWNKQYADPRIKILATAPLPS